MRSWRTSTSGSAPFSRSSAASRGDAGAVALWVSGFDLFYSLLDVEIDRVKTTFFSNVSHEFRTPLSSILGYVELISDDDEHPQELVGVLHDLLRLHHVVVGVVGRHGAGRHDHLGPERLAGDQPRPHAAALSDHHHHVVEEAVDAALQFPLHHPIVASVIPGGFQPAHVRRMGQGDVAVLNGPVTIGGHITGRVLAIITERANAELARVREDS